MNIKGTREKLEAMLKRQMPAILHNCDYFIVFRNAKLLLLAAGQIRIGDIRLLQFDPRDLPCNFSDEQWFELCSKCISLQTITDAVELPSIYGD